jgi:hypothetical protein
VFTTLVRSCVLDGELNIRYLSPLVYRVPGNFHIEMRSKYHSVHPPVANLSHVVNSLTFGPPIERKVRDGCMVLFSLIPCGRRLGGRCFFLFCGVASLYCFCVVRIAELGLFYYTFELSPASHGEARYSLKVTLLHLS